MRGFTDIHHHLLWGMDDGARDSREAREMLLRAAGDGIDRIVATPHATPGVARFDRERFERTLAEARARCAAEGLGIELRAGAEILYTPQTCRLLREGDVPAMADTDRVLVEFSPDARYERLREALGELRAWGYRPILAHAERCDCLRARPSRMEELRAEMDVQFQINCAALLRPGGPRARRMIGRALARGLADYVATDAHRARGARAAEMRAAWAMLRDRHGDEVARALTDGGALFGRDGESTQGG